MYTLAPDIQILGNIFKLKWFIATCILLLILFSVTVLYSVLLFKRTDKNSLPALLCQFALTFCVITDMSQTMAPSIMWQSPTHQVALRDDQWRVKCIFSGR